MTNREQQLEGMVKALADRLAIAVLYLTACDDAIEPLVLPRDWPIANLVQRALMEIFGNGGEYSPTEISPAELVAAAQNNEWINVHETAAFGASMDSVRSIMKSLNSKGPNPRKYYGKAKPDRIDTA